MAALHETTATATVPRQRSAGGFHAAEGRTAFFFLLPSLLGVTLFLVLPIIASLVLSFTNWKLLGAPAFVGIANWGIKSL